jgi:hypothetical protein|tara:strand:- start:3732 stop:3932 length:201 start_codon:yes stop_codon:yes gene_type:complete
MLLIDEVWTVVKAHRKTRHDPLELTVYGPYETKKEANHVSRELQNTANDTFYVRKTTGSRWDNYNT